MGLIDNIKAISSVKKMQRGETVKLSMAQVSSLIINLIDAKKNLSPKQYNEVFELLKKYQGCKTKLSMDLNGYYETCIEIILKFDAIAPYEKYSGNDEFETSLLMEDIKAMKNDVINNDNFGYNNFQIEELGKYIYSESNESINIEESKSLAKIMITSNGDKEKILSEFKIMAIDIVNKYGFIYSISKISFMLGVLNGNNYITNDELNNYLEQMKKHFINI